MQCIAVCNTTPPPTSTDPMISELHIPFRMAGYGGTDSSLIQASLGAARGEGLPAVMSLEGTSTQMEVLDRWSDGSPRVFRAIAPLSHLMTESVPGDPGSAAFAETVAGTAGATLATTTRPDVTQLSWRLGLTAGGYTASIATATSSKVIVGVGNERGRSGPEYYRITRYFCPFFSDAARGNPVEQRCGALVVYIHERADLDGCMIQARFTGSMLTPDTSTDDGDQVENPGYVIYSSLSSPSYAPGGYQYVGMDTYTGDGGASAQFAAKPFNASGARHVLPPGVAPAWTWVMRRGGALPNEQLKAVNIMYGRDCAFAWSGRGFQTNSDFGFGASRFRYNFPAERGTTFSDLADLGFSASSSLTSSFTNGSGSESTSRQGTSICLSTVSPNGTGGTYVSGHGMYLPVASFVQWLRVYAMAESRRSNHDYYLTDGDRHLQSSDFEVSVTDDQGTALGSTYHTYESTSAPQGSAQFAGISPVSGRFINGHSPNPTSEQLHIYGLPTGRPWNEFGPSETAGAEQEDWTAGAFGQFGSHNIAHSSRLLSARESWLFSMDCIGLDMTLGYAAFCASYHMPYESQNGSSRYGFFRQQWCLSAWGDRDLNAQMNGQSLANRGVMYARRKGNLLGPDKIGPLNITSSNDFSSSAGLINAGYVTNRIAGWSFVWQATACGIGDDSIRSYYLQAPNSRSDGSEGNPFRLMARAIGNVTTVHGFCSTSGEPTTGAIDYRDQRAGSGGTPLQTDFATRLGGQPYGGDVTDPDITPDLEWWTSSGGFHDDYFTLGADVIYDVLDGLGENAEAELVRPVLMGRLLQLAGNAAFLAGDGTQQIGNSKHPIISKGLRGAGDRDSLTLPNDGPTELEVRNGDLCWIQDDTLVPINAQPIFYSYEIENLGLSILMVLRYGTTAQRQEVRSLYNRIWRRPPGIQMRTLFDIIGLGQPYISNFRASSSARAFPLTAEGTRYVQ